MKYTDVRNKLDLSQSEIAILFGIPVGSIRNWEQEVRSPDSAAITLYDLAAKGDQLVLCALVAIACEKRYVELRDAHVVLRTLIPRFVGDKLSRSLLEMVLLKSNPQWKPEELGFRVTKINFSK